MKSLVAIGVLVVVGLLVDRGRERMALRLEQQQPAPARARVTMMVPLPYGGLPTPPASLRRPEQPGALAKVTRTHRAR